MTTKIEETKVEQGKQSHTPGPWEANGAVVHARDKHRQLMTIASTHAECWRGIAGVETDSIVPGIYGDEDEGQGESYANARLIAAAPALLAALEELSLCVDQYMSGTLGSIPTAIRFCSKEAIAAAKGESL